MAQTAEIEALQELLDYISEHRSANIERHKIANDELTIILKPQGFVSTMQFLRDNSTCQFVVLLDVTAVDYPGRDPRFDVVYHLLSPQQNARLRIKLQVDDGGSVPSLCDVYPAADWFERETYDLYGIYFKGHTDLRRILTDYGFEGHPLRKDFPLTGFHEVRWDEEQKRVMYEPVQLMQEFRSFDFLSPWEGTDYVLPGDERAKQEEK